MQENCLDFRPKHINLEKSERWAAKKDVQERLAESDQLMVDRLEMDEREREEEEAAWQCWLREKADPNYICRCFEKKDNL